MRPVIRFILRNTFPLDTFTEFPPRRIMLLSASNIPFPRRMKLSFISMSGTLVAGMNRVDWPAAIGVRDPSLAAAKSHTDANSFQRG